MKSPEEVVTIATIFKALSLAVSTRVVSCVWWGTHNTTQLFSLPVDALVGNSKNKTGLQLA